MSLLENPSRDESVKNYVYHFQIEFESLQNKITCKVHPRQKSWHSADCDDRLNVGPMLVRCRRSTVDCQRWYNVEKQFAQPYSDCGKSNLPTVDVQGPSSIYSAPVVNCKIPTFVQCWIYNRPNLLPTVEKVIFQQ